MPTEVGSLFVKLGLDPSGLSSGLKEAESTADAFGSVLKKIFAGISLALVVREITNFTKSIVNAAAESEIAAMNLKRAVENSGASRDAARVKLDEFLAAEVRLTGFDDETASRSIANLTDMTGSYEKALKLLPLAMDLARGKSIDLATASEYVGRASQGNAMMLARQMGILSSTMNATELLAEAQRRYGGYAQQYINSQVGAYERLQTVIGNLKESLGNALLPLTSSINTILASLGDSLAPQLDTISEQIRTWALNAAADMFYWGANMVQSLASGIIGSSAVVDALNSLGNYFTYMLEAHSPPRLLPELETWGANAAKAYFEGWAGVTPIGTQILEGWGKSLQPYLSQLDRGGGMTDEMRKALSGKFGSSAPVMTEYLSAYDSLNRAIRGTQEAQDAYNKISDSGDKESVKAAKDKLDKAKTHESQERARFATAQSRLRAEAESQARLRMATQQQTAAIQAQTTAIQQQAIVQSDASEKALASARLAWQMAQTDTAGKIALLQAESEKYAEGSVEWYQYQTQKINMEKQLQKEQEATASGGAASVESAAADLSVLKNTLTEVKSNLVEIGDGLFIDPLTMQISKPPPDLWGLVQELGRSLGNDFIGQFIDIMWKEFKISLGVNPDADMIDLVTTLGANLGLAIGDAMWGSIKEKLTPAFVETFSYLADNLLAAIIGTYPGGVLGLISDTITGNPLPGYGGAKANGMDAIVARPTLFLAGEAGAERVTVTPTGKASSTGSTVINIYTPDARGVVYELRRQGFSQGLAT